MGCFLDTQATSSTECGMRTGQIGQTQTAAAPDENIIQRLSAAALSMSPEDVVLIKLALGIY